MTPRIELRAKVRAEPLPVCAVFARGAVAHVLARRLLERVAPTTEVGVARERVERERIERERVERERVERERVERERVERDRVDRERVERERVDPEPAAGVSVVRAEHDGLPVLVAIGAPERLPWVDGAIWLGRAPEAPSVWLPTLCALEPHPALVASALAPDVSAPFVLVPDGLVSDRSRWIALSLARAQAVDVDLLAPLVVEANP